MSDVYQSLAHSQWDCKYHVEFSRDRRELLKVYTAPLKMVAQAFLPVLHIKPTQAGKPVPPSRLHHHGWAAGP